MSNAFGEFCNEHGIERQHTMRNKPQQNGVAERVNCTLEEGITAMLQEAHLPPSFWGEALHTLVYTLNRTPRSANPGITSYEAFFGVNPDVSNLCIFGLLAYVHVQKDKCSPSGFPLVLTWRSASSLAMRMVTRDGASTTQPPSALCSLSTPSLMRGISLDSTIGTRRSSCWRMMVSYLLILHISLPFLHLFLSFLHHMKALSIYFISSINEFP
jgi:hypothetical protein